MRFLEVEGDKEMVKIGTPVARKIVAMLLRRERSAFRRYRRAEAEQWGNRVIDIMNAHWAEAHNAAETARQMLGRV
jgi:hypothetical protein